MKNYGPGEPVKSLAQFEFALRNGVLLFVKCWNKTVHPIVLANMPYRVARGFIDREQVFIAKKI
jgi:hypothetical protein